MKYIRSQFGRTKNYSLIVILALACIFITGIIIFNQFNTGKTPKPNPNPNTPSSDVLPKNLSDNVEPNKSLTLDYQVPILEYHYIRDPSLLAATDQEGKNLSVGPLDFSSQLKWLQDNDYETIKVSDLADPKKTAIAKVLSTQKKPIALTFDDGYLDAYSAAFPLLEKYDFVGTFYIIRGFVGRPLYMNQSQINILTASGMEIGSHTISHPDLSKINESVARHQIFESRDGALTFCYPSGKYNDTTLQLVQEAGYTTAVTEISGIANQNSNLYTLPRVRVRNISGAALGSVITKMAKTSK